MGGVIASQRNRATCDKKFTVCVSVSDHKYEMEKLPP